MTESAMPGITPEAILAYLDGEDLPHVAAYLQTSSEGAGLAAEYRTLQGNLTHAFYRHTCPATQHLGDYHLRLLTPADHIAIAAHVTTCPLCAAELAQIRTFLAIEDDPPPLGLFARARRQLIATLAKPPAAAGAALRGTAAGDAQTYQVQDITITLDPLASAPRGRGTLTGLVVVDRDLALTDAPVTLIDSDGTTHATAIDEFGNFVFEAIVPGEYQLEVVLGDDTVAIKDLHIGR